MATHQRTRPKVCASCSIAFVGHGNSKYCSNKCLNKTREDRRALTCSQCGSRMWNARTIAQVPLCQQCRRARPGYRDRAKGRQVQAWVCGACGVECSRPTTKGQRPKWCLGCAKIVHHRDIKVTPTERIAIYNSDNWTCWLCCESVDRSLIGSRSVWRPSLDHVVPRSIGGSDDRSNLRLAHMWCNSLRSDGRTYSPEDFRVAN